MVTKMSISESLQKIANSAEENEITGEHLYYLFLLGKHEHARRQTVALHEAETSEHAS